MDKFKLTGQNLGRVFNNRNGCTHVLNLFFCEAKAPNVELKTRLEQSPVCYQVPPLFGEPFYFDDMNLENNVINLICKLLQYVAIEIVV